MLDITSMEYGITCLVLAPPGFIPVSKERFEQVRVAKRNLVRIVVIEETFDFLVENYREYEHDLLDLALQQMVHNDWTWHSFRFDIQRINRRTANLLSAGTSYLDQTRKQLAADQGEDPEILAAFDEMRRRTYEAKLGYRAMQELRGYAQHRSFPVHRMSFPSSWEPPGKFENLVFRVNPQLELRELREDPKFKSDVLRDLEAIGEQVPITPLVRGYVEGLFEIHEFVRRRFESAATTWEAELRRVLSDARNEFGGDKPGLAIVARDDRNVVSDSEEVFDHLLTYRARLQRKNGFLMKLSSRYVSGQAPGR